jgi:WhiB family redox-sensing transcriptional regulator
MTVRTNWHEDVACRDADPDLFFPIGTTGAALRQMEAAKRICRVCPVQMQCLAWALEIGVTDGVWGGAGRTGAPSGAYPGKGQPLRQMAMTRVITRQRRREHGIRAQAAP